jgi:hypothetical protein
MKTDNRPHALTLRLTAQEFWQQLWNALGHWTPLMERCWSYAPGLTVRVETRLVVTVDFDLKNLPHRGRRFFILTANQDIWTPESIARFVAEEIYDHSATCPDCGWDDGWLDIQQRLDRGILVAADPLEAELFPKLAAKMAERLHRNGTNV